MNVFILCLAMMFARSGVLANPGDDCASERIYDDLLRLNVRLQIDRIIPDALSSPPESVLGMRFETVTVDSGNCIRPAETVLEPVYELAAVEPKAYYTVAVLNVDLTSRVAPILRFGILGLYLNVRGRPGEPFVPSSGFPLCPYISPAPTIGSGPQRILGLAYIQKAVIDTKSRNLINVSIERVQFDLEQFVRNYTLGNPVAANYWISDHCCAIDLNNCCNQ